jgi:hypothetical protein
VYLVDDDVSLFVARSSNFGSDVRQMAAMGFFAAAKWRTTSTKGTVDYQRRVGFESVRIERRVYA